MAFVAMEYGHQWVDITEMDGLGLTQAMDVPGGVLVRITDHTGMSVVFVPGVRVVETQDRVELEAL